MCKIPYSALVYDAVPHGPHCCERLLRIYLVMYLMYHGQWCIGGHDPIHHHITPSRVKLNNTLVHEENVWIESPVWQSYLFGWEVFAAYFNLV